MVHFGYCYLCQPPPDQLNKVVAQVLREDCLDEGVDQKVYGWEEKCLSGSVQSCWPFYTIFNRDVWIEDKLNTVLSYHLTVFIILSWDRNMPCINHSWLLLWCNQKASVLAFLPHWVLVYDSKISQSPWIKLQSIKTYHNRCYASRNKLNCQACLKYMRDA